MTRRFGVVALAVGTSAIFGSLAYAAGVNVDAIAGVYKHRFKNALVSGEKYKSEDILEIVKVSPTSVYVSAHLEFFNGHECAINGVAKADGNALVYRGETNAEGKQCLLSVKVSGEQDHARRQGRHLRHDDLRRAAASYPRSAIQNRSLSEQEARDRRLHGQAECKSDEYLDAS